MAAALSARTFGIVFTGGISSAANAQGNTGGVDALAVDGEMAVAATTSNRTNSEMSFLMVDFFLSKFEALLG